MTLIVADTGPINYLIQIGQVQLLSKLAARTVMPATVQSELLHEAAPAAVRTWAARPPAWIEIRWAKQMIEANDIAPADREAISLARELTASILLMDDLQARRCAASFGVMTMGTLGLLEAAAAQGLILLPETLKKLQATSFFLTRDLLDRALQRDAERPVRASDGTA